LHSNPNNAKLLHPAPNVKRLFPIKLVRVNDAWGAEYLRHEWKPVEAGI